jgi:hypothetical protein
MFFKKLNKFITALNLHSPFVSGELTIWIFIIFWHSKIHVSPTSVVSSISPPRCRLSSSRCRHAVTSCHTSFPLSQDELAASASSYSNTLSRRLPSRVETEAFNLHHHRTLPFLDHPTLTLDYYKKIISTLVTLSTTQPRRHFVSSLARTPRHRSFTHRRRSPFTTVSRSSDLRTTTSTMMI